MSLLEEAEEADPRPDPKPMSLLEEDAEPKKETVTERIFRY